MAICTFGSDFHLEFGAESMPGGDVLIIAGDMVVASHFRKKFGAWENASKADILWVNHSAQVYRQFFKECSERYRFVLYVPGNHEHYWGDIESTLQILRDEVSMHPNIHVMNDNVMEIDGVVFIGSTLWTDFFRGNPVSMEYCRQNMKDFKVIRMRDQKLQPGYIAHLHGRSKKFIVDTAQANKDKTVVMISHHAPSHLSIDPEYKGDGKNGGYVSDLSDLILDNPNIKVWIHGHTHQRLDYTIGDCRILCNARGYMQHEPWLVNTFNKNCTFTVGA